MIGRINNDGVVLYDGNPEPHDHLPCTVCNKFYDVPKIDIDKENVNKLIESSGMQIENYFVTYEGICKKCREK